MLLAHISLELLCVAFGMFERQCWDVLDQGVDDSGQNLMLLRRLSPAKAFPTISRKLHHSPFSVSRGWKQIETRPHLPPALTPSWAEGCRVLCIFTPSHNLRIYILTPSHLQISSRSFFYLSLKAGRCRRRATKRNPFARNGRWTSKTAVKLRFWGVHRNPFARNGRWTSKTAVNCDFS